MLKIKIINYNTGKGVIDIKRSVYSLVLMDDVIRAIDQMAYQMSTSRSNLINQILAEKVMLTTPEMRMKDIFDKMMMTMESEKKFQVQLQPSDYCISIRSALNYKYNPTIRYFIELYRNGDTAIGELKVTSRTQSAQLQKYLYRFFKYFTRLESIYMTKYFPGRPAHNFTCGDDGRFARELILIEKNHKLSTDIIAAAIGDYIQLIDTLLTIYLKNINNIEIGLNKIESHYVEFLNNSSILM